MKARLLTGPLSLLLLFASLARAQDDAATREAQRQGQVALNPTATSPSQTERQAIAFERFKDLAAQREARKEAGADRSIETPRPAKTKK